MPRCPLRSLPAPYAAALPSCQAGIRAQGGQKGLLGVGVLPGGAEPANLCLRSQTGPKTSAEAQVRLKIEIPSSGGSEGVMGNSARRPLDTSALAWHRGHASTARGGPMFLERVSRHPSSPEASQPPSPPCPCKRPSRKPLQSDFSLQRCCTSCFLI